MDFYPIMVDIKQRPCTVIGGGTIAERKTETLMACGAQVRVISPEFTPVLLQWATEGRITTIPRLYQDGDLEYAFLVISATDNMAVNAAVADEANLRRILLNVVDIPQLCNFIVPAVVQKGPLVIAVSTGGTSPAMAKKIRQDLDIMFGPEYGVFLQLLGSMRNEVKGHFATQAERQKLWEAVIESDILAIIAAGKIDEAEEKIRHAIACTGT
jgi:precorrin-2 dehydrogenase/sirohydrochlorin ferrochelatase